MGWVNLITLYQRATGKNIKLVPVYIDQAGKTFYVRKGIYADPERPIAEQSAEIEAYIAACIRGETVE